MPSLSLSLSSRPDPLPPLDVTLPLRVPTYKALLGLARLFWVRVTKQDRDSIVGSQVRRWDGDAKA